MAAYPKTLDERAKLYLHCMLEIKERLRLVFKTFGIDAPDLFKNEICSLQFRHICELMAIACLAAQGDFQTQRAFRDDYNPQKIFTALRKIFPSFFPLPTIVTLTPGSDDRSNHHHVAINQQPDTLDADAIIRLWSRSGDDLHRLSVKKYLKRSFSEAPSIEQVGATANALATLLNTHLIPIGSPDELVFLDFRMDDGQGNAVAHFITLDRATGIAAVTGYQAKIVSYPNSPKM